MTQRKKIVHIFTALVFIWLGAFPGPLVMAVADPAGTAPAAQPTSSGDIPIKNVTINTRSTQAVIHFQTDVPTSASVTMTDVLVVGSPPRTQPDPNPTFATSHIITVNGLPPIYSFAAKITVTSADGKTGQIDGEPLQFNASGLVPGQGTNFQPAMSFPVEDPGANKGKLQIKNFQVEVVDNTTAKITFETTIPAGSTGFARSKASQITTSGSPSEDFGATSKHLTLCHLEPNQTYEFAVTASSGTDRADYFDPKPVTLTGTAATQPTENCGNSSNFTGNGPAGPNQIAGANTPSTSTSQGGPLAALLTTADGSPRTLVLGKQTVTLNTLLWWLLMALVGLSTLLEIFFFIKHRRLWGVVYDARSKQPVEMAIVRLFDQKEHKLLETRVTNRSGRYSFLAEPGEYYMDVTKQAFHFPTRIVTSQSDNEYINVYHGELVKLGAGQSLIARDIPIDSEESAVARVSFYRRFVFPLLEAIRLPLLFVTLLFLIIYGFVILQPTPLFFFLLTILGVLFLIEFIFVRRGSK